MKHKETHLIMINYYFPPIVSPGVSRNYNIAKAFDSYIDNVSVYTTSNRNILVNDNAHSTDRMTIFEIPTYDFRTLTAKFTDNKTTHFDDKKKQSVVAKFLIKLKDTFPFNILIGEGGLRYVLKAFFSINRYLKKHPNTLIYTSFRPYSDLYIGYLLKKRNPSITWIADFRDLHIEPIYKNVFLPKTQIWWNTKMLRHADLITSVSEGLIHQLKKYNRPTLPLINGVTIPPTLDYYKKFTISYTGSLFKNERDPSILFESLQYLLESNLISADHFQIIYAGKDGAKFKTLINRYALDSILTNHNMVSKERALIIQSRSHINLLLSVNNEEHKGVLTGKLFEYLGALNSILLIMIGNYDPEFEQLFKTCNAGKIYYTQSYKKDDITNFILESYNKWNTSNINPKKMDSEQIKSMFSWDKSVQKVLNKLNLI